MLVIGVLEAFRQITDSVTKGRATVQISGQLRNITNVMRAISRMWYRPFLTPPPVPAGYFEIIEGIDNDFVNTNFGLDNLTGDTDDVIMFTSRRLEPVLGRIEGRLLDSTRNFEIVNSSNSNLLA